MSGAVKMRHINNTIFEVSGVIPKHIIKYLEQELGNKFRIINDDLVSVEESKWYKDISISMKAGDYIKIYRQNAGLTQKNLGDKLGEVSRQYVSDLENGRRIVSKTIAKKLSVLFKVPIDRFI